MARFDFLKRKSFQTARATAAATTVAAVSTANATDLATAVALANANKTAFNALLTQLKAGGYVS